MIVICHSYIYSNNIEYYWNINIEHEFQYYWYYCNIALIYAQSISVLLKFWIELEATSNFLLDITSNNIAVHEYWPWHLWRLTRHRIHRIHRTQVAVGSSELAWLQEAGPRHRRKRWEQMAVVVSIWGVPARHGVSKTGWFMMENPNLKWMMTGGTPISGNLYMGYISMYIFIVLYTTTKT